MYGHNLKEIYKNDVKVGDVVGVAYNVQIGWGRIYKHSVIKPVKIARITPKRTKFVSDDGAEFDKYTPFYVLDETAMKETELALAMTRFIKASNDIDRWKRNSSLNDIPDGNVGKLVDLMSEVAKILNGEERENE